MAAGQPLRATFFAFRKREGGGFLIGASIMVVVLAGLLIAAFVALNWGAFARWGEMMRDAGANQTPSDEQVFGMMGTIFALFGWMIVFLFFLYVLFASYEAACLRWMIRRERGGGLFGLNLSADTWRVYSGYWVWLAIQWAVSTVVSLVTMPFIFMGMAGGMTSSDPTAMMSSMIGVQIVQMFAQYGLLAFFGVRFAPAAATSIARRKFSFFQAWTVTKGRFWALFGSFFVIYLLFSVLYMLVVGVAFGIVLGGSWEALGGFSPTASPAQATAALEALFSPRNMIIFGAAYAMMLPFGLLFAVACYGINARAVLAAIEEGKVEGVTPEMASVFD